jgi:hypothetical protein
MLLAFKVSPPTFFRPRVGKVSIKAIEHVSRQILGKQTYDLGYH